MGDRDHWGAGWNGNGEGVRHYTNLTEESSSLSFKSPAFPSTLEAFWILAQPHPPPWLASLQRGNGHPQLATPPDPRWLRPTGCPHPGTGSERDPGGAQHRPPQAKRLRLSLNMLFAVLDDPKGIAKNVAGLGRWGNGEVEFGVASLEEVPYALGLIRQSQERQLDDAPGAP